MGHVQQLNLQTGDKCFWFREGFLSNLKWIKYSFVPLLLDRFVRGKPFMTCNEPLMSYCSDVLQAQTFTITVTFSTVKCQLL